MEAYRSGHNELDSKSSCPQGHVGSNPTASAMLTHLQSEIAGFFFLILLNIWRLNVMT